MTREENLAPVRILTTQRKPSTGSEYPRNHKQMAKRVASSNAGKLVNTVLQANRQRSVSFTATGLPSYFYNIKRNSSGISVTNGQKSQLTHLPPPMNMDKVDQNIWSGRSKSLPPTSSTMQVSMSMGYPSPLQRRKKGSSQDHHLFAVEKATAAAYEQLTRHQTRRNQQQMPKEEKLMAVDSVLKQRMASRFVECSMQQLDKKALPAGVGPLKLDPLRATELTNSVERTRFQTLDERIRQFGAIQFTDGPADYNSFNRHQGYCSGQIQQSGEGGSRHLPKQLACLSFCNILHTNYRQRSLNSSRSSCTTSEVDAVEKPPMPLPKPLGPLPMPLRPLQPLEPLTLNRQPQQQQQQQHQQQQPPVKLSENNNPPTLPSSIPRTRSKRSIKQATATQINTVARVREKDKERKKQKQKQVLLQKQSWESMRTVVKNPVSRAYSDRKLNGNSNQNNIYNSNNKRNTQNSINTDNKKKGSNIIVNHMQKFTPMPSPSSFPRTKRLVDELGTEHKAKEICKVQEEQPKQPKVKLTHPLLAASASQVTAFRRALNSRQQVQQAELMHSLAVLRQQQEEQQPLVSQQDRQQELQYLKQQHEEQQQLLKQQQQLQLQRQQLQRQQLQEQQQRQLHQPPVRMVSGKHGKLKQSLQLPKKLPNKALPAHKKLPQQQPSLSPPSSSTVGAKDKRQPIPFNWPWTISPKSLCGQQQQHYDRLWHYK